MFSKKTVGIYIVLLHNNLRKQVKIIFSRQK